MGRVERGVDRGRKTDAKRNKKDKDDEYTLAEVLFTLERLTNTKFQEKEHCV